MGTEICDGCGSRVAESNMEAHRLLECDAGLPEEDGESQLTAKPRKQNSEDNDND